MMRDEERDIIGTKPVRDETEGLALFATAARAVPTVALFVGAGQRARREARDQANPKAGRLVVLRALEQSPRGLTRLELHHLTGLPINTINARIAELSSAKLHAAGTSPVYTDGLRDTLDDDGRMVRGSVCHARIHQAKREGAA